MAVAELSDMPAFMFTEFHEILQHERIRTLYQPIVSLRDGSIHGYEALSRGQEGSALESPFALFALAEYLGVTWELEYACRRLAIERFARLQSEALLFLNVNPTIMQDSRFHQGMTKDALLQAGVPASRVVLELTERTAITNYPDFTRMLDHYRGQGFRVAVDDLGAGYSGLNLLCQVRPKYLKVDMALIRDIHRDTFKQQMVKFTVDFARATESTLIAEGIEQEAELLTLLELGVDYGQGFLLQVPREDPQGINEEVYTRLRAGFERRLSRRLSHIVTVRVGDYCQAKLAIESREPCATLEDRFTADEELLGVPVVENARVMGLIMREKYYARMSSQYGYALFKHRPVRLIMDEQPLVVDFSTPLEIAVQAAMERPPLKLYDHVLITLNDRYFGTITVRDMLARITEQAVKYAQCTNPLSGLPGNLMIQREIERVIHTESTYAVLYFDLDHFKPYNDVYGFDRGDEVLKRTADLLTEVMAPDCPDAFVGHIGGDDFVVVVPGTVAESTLDRLIARFDDDIPVYYDDIHLAQGYINSVNRVGQMESFPLLTLSVAIVTHENGPFASFHEVAKRATEMKKQCKAIMRSCYLFDRRQVPDALPALAAAAPK